VLVSYLCEFSADPSLTHHYLLIIHKFFQSSRHHQGDALHNLSTVVSAIKHGGAQVLASQ